MESKLMQSGWVKNINISREKLLIMYECNLMPNMKISSVFASMIQDGSKEYEFRKSEKWNQTGWVSVEDMDTMELLFFMYLDPKMINPYISASKINIENVMKYTASTLIKGLDQVHIDISKEEYDFLMKHYVKIADFIMFHIIKVVK